MVRIHLLDRSKLTRVLAKAALWGRIDSGQFFLLENYLSRDNCAIKKGVLIVVPFNFEGLA